MSLQAEQCSISVLRQERFKSSRSSEFSSDDRVLVMKLTVAEVYLCSVLLLCVELKLKSIGEWEIPDTKPGGTQKVDSER